MKVNVFTFSILFLVVPIAFSQTVVEDGFESEIFSGGWGITAGVAINNGSGANASSKFATLSPYSSSSGRELGARFDTIIIDGARDFTIEFYLRVKDSMQRQFNLHISDSTGAIGSGSATVNLRYQNGWSAYANNTWNTIPGLNNIIPGQWHKVKIAGTGWGTTSTVYSIEVSDTNGQNYTSLATNLIYFQTGNPRTNTAKFFVFSTVYGNNPGFDVDEVKAVVAGISSAESNLVVNISGTYPHLAVFNNAGECGIGAVAEYAGKLWFLTYPPHAPNGSADKLWSVDTNLSLEMFAGSVGGTHACRMIHPESGQLIIGPYFINSNAQIRVVSPYSMPGRLTAIARHLIEPVNKVYFATMEEGFYEVNVNTLEVTLLYPDTQSVGSSILPGYHGKGAYTGQGRIIFANNGEPGWNYNNDEQFNGPSGVLAENTLLDFTNGWKIIERKNFCEVTGPGGIYGFRSRTEPIWILGWDKRSVILKLLDNGSWYSYRLPKASYTHDALHGWYTEWPRIREITNGFYLAHMHGLFYNFPSSFSSSKTFGITPICSYLKMPVDYCWWNGMLVMGRDDASTTGNNKWAGQSHSTLWFGKIKDLESWGAPSGFGGVYLDDEVVANVPSEPFLVYGYSNIVLHLRVPVSNSVSFVLQYDENGNGDWRELSRMNVSSTGYSWYKIPKTNVWWIRLVPQNNSSGVTAYLHLFNRARKENPQLFDALAVVSVTNSFSDGIIRPKDGNARYLQFAANIVDEHGNMISKYFEIGGDFNLKLVDTPDVESALRTQYTLNNSDFSVDSSSVVYTSGGVRYRLPKNGNAFDKPFVSGYPRGIREVVTERNLLQAHGTFYELPRSDAGGIRRIRPVCSHNKHISDFASWRGLLVMTGVRNDAKTDNVHVFKSQDGAAGLWFGDIDDLWKMGEPSGIGGPWNETQISSNIPSDPYLFYGYDRKILEISHKSNDPITFTVEVDFAADGVWSEYAKFTVEPGKKLRHIFPDSYSAHWIRLKSDKDTIATAIFYYGNATPKIGSITVAPEGIVLRFSGKVGTGYTVLASTNLTQPLEHWRQIDTGKFETKTAQCLDKSVSTSDSKFYAIKIID